MMEQFKKVHDQEAPLSYIRGTNAITGCFATKEVTVKNYIIAAHSAHGSAGDHRLHVIDLCAVSVMGVELSTITKRAGRRLQYKLRNTRKYRRDPVKIYKWHRMENKAKVMADENSF